MISMRQSTVCVTALLAGLLGGCRGGISEKPPVHLVLDMDFQPKLTAQSESSFWPDHRGMRLPEPNTVARGSYADDVEHTYELYDTDGNGKLDACEAGQLRVGHVFEIADADGDGGIDKKEYSDATKLFSYRKPDGSFVTENARPATLEVLERGRQRFTIYCSVCHGVTGKGGMVAKRWPTPIPDLVTNADASQRARLTSLPYGQIVGTITEGKGLMPSYAAQIKIEDRWAIAHYLRALQNHFN